MKNKNSQFSTFNSQLKMGFTMIELLIVIAIIGILTTASLFALRGTRESARDGVRKSNLAAIATSMEVYKSDCNYYPNSLSAGNPIKGNDAPCAMPASNIYLEAVPDDPVAGKDYYYEKLSCSGGTRCTRFRLWAALEEPPAAPPAGCPSSGPSSCGSSGNCNYCVTSP